MSKPHKCPVCDGEGYKLETIYQNLSRSSVIKLGLTVEEVRTPCHACKTTGIVWEKDECGCECELVYMDEETIG